MKTLKLKRTHANAILPKRAYPDDAGLDLTALESVTLAPHSGVVTRTGVAIQLDVGYVAMVADRSSMAKRGLKTAGGIIDSGYRGEIHIVIRNMTNETVQLEAGERIAQLLILPIATPAVVEVSELDDSSRGEKGFGSSGR
jgi:dUTP pyrophosphatase